VGAATARRCRGDHRLRLARPYRYDALAALRGHRYGRRIVLNPPTDGSGRPIYAVPAVLVDRDDGERYVTARHLAVFLRYDLGVEALSEDALLSRMRQIGGERRVVERWNVDRTRKLRLVLYRLPQDNADDEDQGDG
jgi:hypothetical protein